ncbi:MAG: GNAT family N-acetyltransferase [Rhizomicrobium sp.]
MSAPVVRAAREGDENAIVALLRDLAIYERLGPRFRLTEETVARDMLGEAPAIRCDLAYLEDSPAGIMTWYFTYSSFAGARGIYLEDFYVRPELRRSGIGRALMAHLAGTAAKHGAARIEWAVLTWNRPAMDFYESVRAQRVDDWHVYRLAGEALAQLASA